MHAIIRTCIPDVSIIIPIWHSGDGVPATPLGGLCVVPAYRRDDGLGGIRMSNPAERDDGEQKILRQRGCPAVKRHEWG